MTNNDRMSGVISSAGNNYMFYADGFDFTFFPNEIIESGEEIQLITDDGYLHGIAHSGNRVAVFVGKDINHYSFSRDVHVPVSMYLKSETIYSKEPIDTFRRITFCGGVLDTLLREDMPLPKHDENDSVTIEKHEKCESFVFQTKQGLCTITVGADDGFSWGSKKIEIKKHVYLSLYFENDQSITTIFEHYAHVKRLISVMTNRVENHFDKIILSPDVSVVNWHLQRIIVNIKENDVSSIKAYCNIMFEDLDGSIASLMQLFYKSKKKKPSYSLGFIPKYDEEFGVITEDKVRAICSAIECEICFHPEIENAQSEALRIICQRARDAVNLYREETKLSPTLTDGTYDMINGSISHWSMTAYEKTKLLYHEYEEAITKYNRGKPMVKDEDIHELIKYRNNITHGFFQPFDDTLMKTAIAMEVLVICSLLHRIGIPKETIVELCEMKICR